jgi:hypothetical protein
MWRIPIRSMAICASSALGALMPSDGNVHALHDLYIRLDFARPCDN